MRQRTNKTGAIILIIEVLLIGTIIFMAYHKNHKNDYYISELPEFQILGDVDYTAAGSTNAVVTATTGLYFKSNSIDQDVQLGNSSGNPFWLIIELYLGDGTLLYKSAYLTPGESIDHIKLEQTLAPGVYHNCILVYTYCSRTVGNDPLTRCDMNIEITVV